jgi:SAM-dependent methyltransferase
MLSMAADLHQLTGEQRKAWSAGDFAAFAPQLLEPSEWLCETVGAGRGQRLLDVGTGSGNTALAAARRGCPAVGLDFVRPLLERARARSEAEGLSLALVEGDAQALPFQSGTFDLVVSVFGAMFAPRPERVAAELFRVVRRGGLVAMANYSGDGFLPRFSDLLATFSAPSPVALPSPFTWGDPDEIRRRFDGLAASVEVQPRTLRFAFDSPEEAWTFWQRTNPPLLALRQMLPAETAGELMQQGERLVRVQGRSDGGAFVLESGWTLALARAGG